MAADTAVLEAALAVALGHPVRLGRRVPLAGGDISVTERVESTAGTFVVKTSRRPVADLFAAEAAGLEALRSSGTSLVVPRVIACPNDGTSFLVIEDLGHGTLTAGGDERIGVGLAELHRATATRFGFSRDTFCGTTRQPNSWSPTWVAFYAHARLGHQLALARQAKRLSAEDGQRLERLIGQLDRWLDEPREGPALVHGDLWSGNLHVTREGLPGLIDPAVYYGHREAELGMMRLFGGFGERVFAAYDEAFPLEPGWHERNDLYQLYHLLNHLNLFGGGYRAQVMAIVQRYA